MPYWICFGPSSLCWIRKIHCTVSCCWGTLLWLALIFCQRFFWECASWTRGPAELNSPSTWHEHSCISCSWLRIWLKLRHVSTWVYQSSYPLQAQPSEYRNRSCPWTVVTRWVECIKWHRLTICHISSCTDGAELRERCNMTVIRSREIPYRCVYVKQYHCFKRISRPRNLSVLASWGSVST